MDLKPVSEKDFKHSLKKLLKSENYEDLSNVLNYLAFDKLKNLADEPNMQNLAIHKIEYQLYQNLITTFDTYKDEPSRI